MVTNDPPASRPSSPLLPVALAAAFAPSLAAQQLPPPEQSGIEHVVLVMMENRSFDHMLGWVPHADGRQAGLVYFDKNNVPHETFRLAPDYQGCEHPDPDHTYEGGRVEFNNGACDGWLRAGKNDEFAIGFYKKNDLAFYGKAAKDWTVCDRFFCSIMAETWPNKIYSYSGQTDRLTNAFEFCSLPTILDRCAAANVSARYYFSDVPFLAVWGLQYLPIARPISTFYADCAAGTLPAVSYVDPKFLDSTLGTSADDHPHADIRNGQAFLDRVYEAVTTSPNWSSTVLVITYDEWGGFFDHVPPPMRPVPPADQLAGNDGRLGFRVPTIIVSPFARAGVSSIEFEHSSWLRMIEWRWNLEPLTVRDATANNLALALDFNISRTAPQYNVPQGPFGGICPGALGGQDKWAFLQSIAALLGWLV
jgi:phospholipase C